MVESVRSAFGDTRVFERFRRLAVGLLTTEHRRTITALMEASGKSHCDWSADYRVFSRDVWSSADVFRALVPQIVALHPAGSARIIAALDDTTLRKTGTHIPGVAYRRDPMSPPFHTNLMRAQRFVQTSVAVPFADGPAAARAIPVGFDHAPSANKLCKNASDEDKRLHREQEKMHHLSVYATAAIRRLRHDLNETAAERSTLLIAVDGSYTNGNILTALPRQTHLIGRIRKDAVLHHLPAASEKRGRPRSYGSAITPEQVRQNEAIGWSTIKIFGAGAERDCQIKEVRPLLWRKTGATLALRLIVIRPLAYRRSKTSRMLYRQPAYLITTDMDSPLEQLVQAYFWRWDIEVNHRDEKQLIGLGDAQVRSPKSAHRVPAFTVACYSMLLISAAKIFGIAAARPVTDRPKWLVRSTRKQIRLSTSQLLRRLHDEYRDRPPGLPNFDHFASNVARSLKLPKCSLTLSQALDHALN